LSSIAICTGRESAQLAGVKYSQATTAGALALIGYFGLSVYSNACAEPGLKPPRYRVTCRAVALNF
jgi:hypothetical protein